MRRVILAFLILSGLLTITMAWGAWTLYRAGRRAIALSIRSGEPWTEVRRETKTFDLGSARSLVVENRMGDVRVIAGVPKPVANKAAPPSAGVPPTGAVPPIREVLVLDGKQVFVETLVRRREGVFPPPAKPTRITLYGRASGESGFRIGVSGDPDDNTTRVDLVVRVPSRLAVEVQTDLGDSEVMGVKGAVTVRGFAGDTTISACPGPVTVRRGAGDMRVSGASKAVSVRASAAEVTLTDLTGPVDASTRAGEVSLIRVAGDSVRAAVGTGSVSVELRKGRVGSVVARARIGDATVAIPPGTDCRVRSDVGLGSTENHRTVSGPPSAEAGLVDVGVGIGEITLADADPDS